jgi:hypothetical protein
VSAIDKLREALDASHDALIWHTCPSGGDDELDAKALTALTEARAALDELAEQQEDREVSLRWHKDRVATLEEQARQSLEVKKEAVKRIRDLEAQLSAQPKPLEWREPSTAPRSIDDATPTLLVRRVGGDLYMARCEPGGRWFDDYGAEIFHVVGHLLPSDLPTKGGSDG